MTDDGRIVEIAAKLAGKRVNTVERCMGGGNNRLFRIVTTDRQSYALKEYPERAADTRDRLGTEFGALRFMERCGIAEVPKAIAADPAAGFALYEWIDGSPVAEATDADLDAAVAFIGRLHK